MPTFCYNEYMNYKKYCKKENNEFGKYWLFLTKEKTLWDITMKKIKQKNYEETYKMVWCKNFKEVKKTIKNNREYDAYIHEEEKRILHLIKRRK